MVALTATIADAITPKTTKRNACRVFELNSHGTDVDPEIWYRGGEVCFITESFGKRSRVGDGC